MFFNLAHAETDVVVRPLAEHELDCVSGGTSKPGGVGDGIALCSVPPWWGSKPGGTTDG